MDIRVLHIFRTGLTAERFFIPLFNEELCRGHHVEVAFGRDSSSEHELPVPVHTFPASRSLNPLVLWRSVLALRKIIRQGNYDVIVPHMFWGGLITRLAVAFRRRGRLLYANHALGCYPARKWHVRAGFYLIEKVLSPFMDAITILNQHDFDLVSRGKIVGRDVLVFKLGSVGIDAQAIKEIVEKVDVPVYREQLGVPKNAKVVCFVGMFIPAKGIMQFLKIAREVSGTLENVFFLIAGAGPLEQKVRDYVDSHNLQKQVALLGWRNDPVQIICASDIFCLPTENEGAPVAVQEAMACGTVVLTSCVPGCMDVVEDGKTGLLVDRDDITDFSNKLRMLLGDDEKRREISSNALSAARERFDVGCCAPSWAEAIEKTYEASGKPKPRVDRSFE